MTVSVCAGSVAWGAALACGVAVAFGEQEVRSKKKVVKRRVSFFIESCFIRLLYVGLPAVNDEQQA
jgi:hypothetical protein